MIESEDNTILLFPKKDPIPLLGNRYSGDDYLQQLVRGAVEAWRSLPDNERERYRRKWDEQKGNAS